MSLDKSLLQDYVERLAEAAELKPVERLSSFVLYGEETIVSPRRNFPVELFGDMADDPFTVLSFAMPCDLPTVWMGDRMGNMVHVEVYDGRYEGVEA